LKTPNASKLAAALEALPDGVILCNAAGRVLWANRRARKWLTLPADEGTEARLPAVLPGLPWPPETPGHVRSPEGRLLSVRAWPLAGGEEFVLQVRPASTRSDDWQPLLLRQLLEGLRRPVANIRAAIETLASYPDMASDLAAQFQHIIREQTEALARLLEQTVSAYTRYLQAHWPLERMPAAELLQLMASALQQDARRVRIAAACPPGIVQADRRLWSRLWELLGRQLRQVLPRGKEWVLLAESDERLLWIDLCWQGRGLPPERLRRWLTQTLTLDEQGLSLTLAEVLAWHEADLWVQRDARGARLRLVLPVVRPQP